MTEVRNIHIQGFPIFHIDCPELATKLNAFTRTQRVRKLEDLGIPIKGKGKDLYVSVIDVLEAFIKITIQSDNNQHIPKSEGAKKLA